MSVIEFKNVHKGYGEGTAHTEVLKDINLTVEEGEFLVLLGFSGTGKTTLINLMAGLDSPTKGEVTFNLGLGQGRVPVVPLELVAWPVSRLT